MACTIHPTLPDTDTHKDYARFYFDTTNLPDKRIVGLLACQRDPLLRILRTKVHAAREANITSPPPPKGKAKQKKGAVFASEQNVALKEESKGKLWEVELLDTVIFPEGGGQPSDTGVMRLLDPNGDVTHTFPIEMCLRRKLDSVHLIRIPSGIEIDLQEGREVEIEADWDRRMDQMSIHTSQHLLSAILDAHLSLPTLSWSMQPYPSIEPAYVELPRALTPDEAVEIERLCGEAIKQCKKVWVEFTIQGDDVGKEHIGQESVGTREMRGLPMDYDGGVIRYINIQDTDRNACCGTQSPNTSLLSPLHVIPPALSNSLKSSPTKLYFLSGPRAILALQQASRTLSAAANAVGYGRTDLVERLERAEVARKDTADSLKGLRAELAKLVGEQAIKAGKEGNSVTLVEREEKGTHDFDWLGLVGATYLESFSASRQKIDGKTTSSPLIILTSSITPAPTTSQTLLLIQSTDNDLAKYVNEKIKTALAGRVKGGGARGRYMSKIDGKWGKIEKDALAKVIDDLTADRV
ncbi:cytoplasmic protein [Cryptococcus neoformans Bt1]|nr:cytoplasmic protein [Cryptococcus neoformans var. grubii Bt1]